MSGTPGIRPISLGPGSSQTSLGLGSMSQYSAQILTCITIYSGHLGAKRWCAQQPVGPNMKNKQTNKKKTILTCITIYSGHPGAKRWCAQQPAGPNMKNKQTNKKTILLDIYVVSTWRSWFELKSTVYSTPLLGWQSYGWWPRPVTINNEMASTTNKAIHQLFNIPLSSIYK